ncbi:MAG: hypothetical protein ACYDG2_18345 [Ruminiclostridium sp.]
MATGKTKTVQNQTVNTSKQKVSENDVHETNDKIVPFKRSGINTGSLVPEFAITLKEARKRIDTLKKFVNELMMPGIDYGLVPGINKFTLLKSGAEKIADAYGLSKRVEVTNRLEDWSRNIFHYEVKVILISKSTGTIEAEGIGGCNSKESAYKEQSGHDVINTILKMAKKRAFIDAVLTATRSSDLFTQDVEEMEWLWNKESKGSTGQSIPATRKQLSFIFSIVEQKRIPVEKVKVVMQERYSVAESKQLTIQQASDFIDFLKSLNYQNKGQNKELPTNLCK